MWKAVIAVGLIAVALAALVWSQHRSEPEFVSGFIESQDIRLGSRVGGRVAEVLAREGAPVAGGEILLRLEPYDLEARLTEAQAALAGHEAELARLVAGHRPEEIAQARARRDRQKALADEAVAGPRPLEISALEAKLAVAVADVAQAEREYSRARELFQQGTGTQVEMDAATHLRDQAKAKKALATDELGLAREGTRVEVIAAARAALLEAEQALLLLENGYRSEDVAAAQARVAAAVAAVGVIERQLEELVVKAPGAAVVEACDLEPGDLIAPNAPVIALIDPTILWVRAYVPETRLDLAVGHQVAVRVDAWPERRFAGHISFVSRQAEFTPANVQTIEERSKQVFRIKVVLDEGQDQLRAGMAADVFLEPAR